MGFRQLSRWPSGTARSREAERGHHERLEEPAGLEVGFGRKPFVGRWGGQHSKAVASSVFSCDSPVKIHISYHHPGRIHNRKFHKTFNFIKYDTSDVCWFFSNSFLLNIG